MESVDSAWPGCMNVYFVYITDLTRYLRRSCPVSHFLEDFVFFTVAAQKITHGFCCAGCMDYKYCTLEQTGFVVFEICVKI